MTEADMDWGPRRPTAVSWAGVLLVLVGLLYVVPVGIALVLDSEALLGTTEDTISTIFVLTLALLDLAAGVGIIRLRLGWRLFGMALSAVGAALHVSNIFGAEGDTVVISLNVGFIAVYALVLVLLGRTRSAFG